MPIIDLPPELLRAISISWTMETNHGIAASPFSGHIQTQRGTLERWSFTMRLAKMTRRQAQIAIGFFLRLEGNLNTFRMHDPAACKPLGRATGTPVLSAPAAAGDRQISTTGWTPSTPGILKAGDWIQIGHQLARLTTDANSSATGTATLSIFPRIMLPLDASTPLITHRPQGIFRYLSDLPSYELDASNQTTPYTTALTGSQEILTPELLA